MRARCVGALPSAHPPPPSAPPNQLCPPPSLPTHAYERFTHYHTPRTPSPLPPPPVNFGRWAQRRALLRRQVWALWRASASRGRRSQRCVGRALSRSLQRPRQPSICALLFFPPPPLPHPLFSLPSLPFSTLGGPRPWREQALRQGVRQGQQQQQQQQQQRRRGGHGRQHHQQP